MADERELTAEELQRAGAVERLVLEWRDWDAACDAFRLVDSLSQRTAFDERSRAGEAVKLAVRALVRELGDWRARAEKMEAAIAWADGIVGEFPPRREGQGPYYWRAELLRRAGLVYEYSEETGTGRLVPVPGGDR